MNGTVSVFDNEFEYDFLSGWIKYLRLEAAISQEALAYGICSVSHLSYFENGKKRLRGELIEALLRKLKVNIIEGVNDIGFIRQKFNKLSSQIEGFDYEAATTTYTDLCSFETLLCISPYNIEFKIYRLMYNILVERLSYEELENSIDTLDRVYNSLSLELQHLYMLISGKLIYDKGDHSKGIDRLKEAFRLKETPWINYRLGVAYCLNNEHLKSIQYLEKALVAYLNSGRYRNSMECHSFLGSSYTALRMYEKAEYHYKAVLNGSEYFSLDKNIFGVYTSLASLYLNMNNLDESIRYCFLAMNQKPSTAIENPWLKASWHYNEQPILAACLIIEIYKKVNTLPKCQEIFDKFLIQANQGSLYYKYLYSLYLSIYHSQEEQFYLELTSSSLPYYKDIGFLNIYIKLQYMLIEFLESKRRYKEANLLYRELLNYTN